MKKLFLIVMVAILGINKLEAQTTSVPDTLAYLQTIVSNKANYIGKSFSFLVNQMQIQIKHFSQNTDIVYDVNKETSTSFGFYLPHDASDVHLAYPRLRITWKIPLNATQSEVLWKSTKGAWSSSVAAFYSNAIIADIKIRE